MKVFGVVGWKNSGKTGLVERLVSELISRGFSVSTVKHAHHSFDVDQPGRDSYRHRAAGARQVLLSSRMRWALMTENHDQDEAEFAQLLPRLDPVDVVLVEGFKSESFPKVEAFRHETGNTLIASSDQSVRAIAANAPLPGLDIPVFALDDTGAIAEFILHQLGLARHDGSGDRHALPPGVDWLAVDDVLNRIRQKMRPVTQTERIGLEALNGRVLARDVTAKRASPPCANSAVDGYGFALDTVGHAPVTLPLVDDRVGPGETLGAAVPPAHAIRILTGGPLPEGVDTVALQENAGLEKGLVHLDRLPKRGSNTRQAGEDKKAGDLIVQAGRVLSGRDSALIASVGVANVEVFRRVRVGVLSTGNEIVAPGREPGRAGIFDANRPMLLATLSGWGCEAVDLGHVDDDEKVIADALNAAATRTDMILTSGGASAGDEDHMAALLREQGQLDLWRIAVKPGRPLAMGHWNGVPVFGLPGNPVAAFVCTLVFARPAIMALAGAGWLEPRGFEVPAGFAKSKKAGRREYLRARIGVDGRVEVFSSEGSGRVSGLSWADGLVELPDQAIEIVPGTPVKYIPFTSYGLAS
jgi:molybdopterin molybdotransferase